MNPSRTPEVELKFDAPQPWAVPELPGFECDPADTIVLRARYWDTGDLRLLAWGHTVRYRASSDGSEGGWTVKVASTDDADDVRRRHEIEVAGDEMFPPELIVAITAPYRRSASLVAVADVTTTRERRRLRSGDTVIELTVDEMTATVDGAEGPRAHEVEIELVEGDEALLRGLVEPLVESGLRPAASTSKLGRAVSGRSEVPAHPLAPPPLGRRSTVADLVRAAVASGTTRMMMHATGVQVGDDPDDVHQTRVATRRLRSDLRTLSPLLDPTITDGLRGELAWLAALLGAVRDLDVLDQHLATAVDELAAAGPAADALLQRVRDERRLRAIELRDVLGAERYRDLCARLIEFGQSPPIVGELASQPADKHARDLADATSRRLRRAVRRLGDDAPDTELHEIRRRTKRARYAHELVAPIVGVRAEKAAKRLARLQAQLGDVQDAVVAEDWLRSAAGRIERADEAFLAGLLVGQAQQHGHRARGAWREPWRRVEATGSLR